MGASILVLTVVMTPPFLYPFMVYTYTRAWIMFLPGHWDGAYVHRQMDDVVLGNKHAQEEGEAKMLTVLPFYVQWISIIVYLVRCACQIFPNWNQCI